MKRLAALLLLLAGPAMAAPDFLPSPKQSYEGFVALKMPRPEVPVGALWVRGYGPVGEPASNDNVETVRSLNGLSIDRNLQLSLTAGLFELLGIEPRYRDRFTARFTDLAIVRVRDLSRLSGPGREPRIIEALKAGSIVLSSDGEAGISVRSGFRLSPQEASGASARTRSYSIEARDMFVALRIATLEVSRSEPRELRLDPKHRNGRADRFEVRVDDASCQTEAALCRAKVAIVGADEPADVPVNAELDESGTAQLELPVPIADRRGGLYTMIRISRVRPCSVQKVPSCGRSVRYFSSLEGQRLDPLKATADLAW